MDETCRLRRGEGYVACGDAVPPRAPKKKLSRETELFCFAGKFAHRPQPGPYEEIFYYVKNYSIYLKMVYNRVT